MASLESRLRAENQSLQEHYEKKASMLSADLEETTRKYVEEKRQLTESHQMTIQYQRKMHTTELDHLRDEHQTMVQKIRESKLLEFAVVQENGSYLATLKNASDYLENASESFEGLRDDMRDKVERLHQERELKLNAQEKRLEGW